LKSPWREASTRDTVPPTITLPRATGAAYEGPSLMRREGVTEAALELQAAGLIHY